MDDAPAAQNLICPYCGTQQPPSTECRACHGRFDQWSLSATLDDMGAWYLRDSKKPHFVGYSYRAIAAAIRAKEIGRDAIVRGPTTRQLWTVARRAPGIAHLFGRCFACQAPVSESSPCCDSCGAAPPPAPERNFLGLPPVARTAAPAGARSDLSAFVEDSSVLLIRVEPVAAPALPPTLQTGTPPAPDAAAPQVGPAHAGLAARARALERTNRLLFGLAVISFLVAVGLVVVLVGVRERHRAETEQRVAEALKSMRGEFERRTPVVVTPKAELPPMPQPPAAQPGVGEPVTPAVP